ncbi:hypothetical protein HDV00_009727 [Rhizophlyctis rosea]|nr:hypothetical protein HDV00_009727 [Rhizophlyctis rosea]
MDISPALSDATIGEDQDDDAKYVLSRPPVLSDVEDQGTQQEDMRRRIERRRRFSGTSDGSDGGKDVSSYAPTDLRLHILRKRRFQGNSEDGGSGSESEGRSERMTRGEDRQEWREKRDDHPERVEEALRKVFAGFVFVEVGEVEREFKRITTHTLPRKYHNTYFCDPLIVNGSEFVRLKWFFWDEDMKTLMHRLRNDGIHQASKDVLEASRRLFRVSKMKMRTSRFWTAFRSAYNTTPGPSVSAVGDLLREATGDSNPGRGVWVEGDDVHFRETVEFGNKLKSSSRGGETEERDLAVDGGGGRMVGSPLMMDEDEDDVGDRGEGAGGKGREGSEKAGVGSAKDGLENAQDVGRERAGDRLSSPIQHVSASAPKDASYPPKSSSPSRLPSGDSSRSSSHRRTGDEGRRSSNHSPVRYEDRPRPGDYKNPSRSSSWDREERYHSRETSRSSSRVSESRSRGTSPRERHRSRMLTPREEEMFERLRTRMIGLCT